MHRACGGLVPTYAGAECRARGSVIGAVAGFLVGNANGPAEVPAYTAVGAVYVYGYLRARTAGGSPTTLSLLRTVSGTRLYVAEIVGSILLLLGVLAGLYIATVAMVILAAYSVSGAWLLHVGVHHDDHERG
jgi:hypothetical protein